MKIKPKKDRTRKNGSPYGRKLVFGHPYPRVGGGPLHEEKKYCRRCRKAFKTKKYSALEVCPSCGGVAVIIPQRARLPKKTASEKTWRDFEKLFRVQEEYKRIQDGCDH